jgi:hypothetical protein
MKISKDRIIGLDVLKFLTLIAIAILHANEFIFYEDKFPLGWKTPIWQISSYYARLFAIGGQVLVSIIYFLFGYTKKSKTELLKISLFSILGQIILGFAFNTFEWDIYTYLFATNILIISSPIFYQRNKYILILSILVIVISPKYFTGLLAKFPFLFFLTGDSAINQSGPWPLLPWFFLATLFYQSGLFLRESNFFTSWSKKESYLWPILFMLSIPNQGYYYWLPIGPNFYRFAFYQHSLTFFSNFLPFIFIGRISLLECVQSKLKDIKLIRLISQSYWNTHLGLTYLVSIVYLGIGINFKSFFLQTPWFFDLFFLGIMPISELFARVLIKMKKKAE